MKLNFGEAVQALKEGKRVSRAGWNGKGMWLVLIVPGAGGEDSILVERVDPEGHFGTERGCEPTELRIDPVIAMRTAQGTLQPGWLASQADMLADDWGIVV
jgi:hypothetical protein